MSLASDYFLLYHGLHFESDEILSLNHEDEDLFCEASALVLSSDGTTFPMFSVIAGFSTLLKKICKASFNSLDELYLLQYTLIKYIQKHKSANHMTKLHKAFNYLADEGLLSIEKHDKLISLFNPHTFHSFDDEILETLENTKDFIEQKNELKFFIDELIQKTPYKDALAEVKEYLDKQKFSIGITGVMNAGKSTLLNALIGKEILRSSVVPETANLSLIKYSQTPYAKVFYWTKSQWKKIQYAAEEFTSIALFVKETEDAFKDELSTYIKEESRVDDISIDDLNLYTSAKYKKSNLIKEIELGVDLEFLSGGIEIVDTPGLDDVVIQREEITKEYLSKCDVMIHLMNVSQSATQKDVDFIIDALLYQNIGKLLIVLTRADSVKESQLNEVINYTKKSIKSQLQARNTDSQLDFILSSLEFVAVSSKMALLHKTGQGDKALIEGYTLENSGILKVEEYLYKTLYGKNSQRSELIINSAKKRIFRILDTQMRSLKYALKLVSKNEKELEQELEDVETKKANNKILIQKMKEEIQEYKDETVTFSKTQESFLDAQVSRAKERLKSRLIDDFIYALEKKRKKEFINGLELILDIAMKDAVIDIIRDYRYKFVQKSEHIENKILAQYEEYELSLGKDMDEISVLDLVEEHFKAGYLHASSALLAKRLMKIFERSKGLESSSTEESIEKELKEAFDILLQSLKQKTKLMNEVLIQAFFSNISKPLEMFEESLKYEEELLRTGLKDFENDEKKRAENSIEIHKQLKFLEVSLKRCAL